MLLVWQLNYDRLDLMPLYTKPTLLNAHLNIIIHTEYFSHPHPKYEMLTRLTLDDVHQMSALFVSNYATCF